MVRRASEVEELVLAVGTRHQCGAVDTERADAVVDLEPESRRNISLLFDLYDLGLSRLAYTIPLERTGVEHGSTYTVEGINAVPTETEVRNAIEELHRASDRPDPADRGNLVGAMLREAVKHLPAD